MLFAFVVTSFSTNENNTQETDIIILKLMGRKLESAYIINEGNFIETKGMSGDQHLQDWLSRGYKVNGTSPASDAGRFSVVYTLSK